MNAGSMPLALLTKEGFEQHVVSLIDARDVDGLEESYRTNKTGI